MTNEELEAIRKRCAAAYPGPWHWERCYEFRYKHWALVRDGETDRVVSGLLVLWHHWDEYIETPADQEDNMVFIAHAREDVPALLAEVERLRDALELYADHSNWSYAQPPDDPWPLWGMGDDGWVLAEEALKG